MKTRNRTVLALALLGLSVADTQTRAQSTYTTPYTFTTLAGDNGGSGSEDGTGSAARFSTPNGVAVDSAGNVYVADYENSTIRKVTPAGVVTTLAGLAGYWGTNDGTGRDARFNYPYGVAMDTNGNVYVADQNNCAIRKVTPTGVVTTLAGPGYGSADGTGSRAQFVFPQGVAVDRVGNVYVADTESQTIRKVTPAGVVTTIAGRAGNVGTNNGIGSAARFNYPSGVAVDGQGNVFVADQLNDQIRQVTPGGAVSTLAGLAGTPGTNDGTGGAARFNSPSGVAVDTNGNVYVADSNNQSIRKVAPTGVVTTLAGLGYGSADGTGSSAQFRFPQGVAVDNNGAVYVADTDNNSIRKVTTGAVVTTLAGRASGQGSTNGTGRAAQFWWPDGVAVDTNGNVFVADSRNDTIRKVTPAGVVTTLAGLAGAGDDTDGTGSAAHFSYPTGLAVDTAGNLYVADNYGPTIRKVTPAGIVTTLAGLAYNSGTNDGTGSGARFGSPYRLAVDSAGSVYVIDNDTIRKITAAGVVTTLAGGGYAVAVDRSDNIYVMDDGVIRRMTPTGEVTNLAGGAPGDADGTGSAAGFALTYGMAVDLHGNVYVAEDNAIRRVTPAGVVTTLAGVAGTDQGFADGTGSAAQFAHPHGVALDNAGNIYLADWANNTVRKGFPLSTVPAPFLQPPSLNAGAFGFGMTGLPGLALDIESSGDLSHWQVVGTYVLDGGTNFFVSPTPPQGAQFYRGHVR